MPTVPSPFILQEPRGLEQLRGVRDVLVWYQPKARLVCVVRLYGERVRIDALTAQHVGGGEYR